MKTITVSGWLVQVALQPGDNQLGVTYLDDEGGEQGGRYVVFPEQGEIWLDLYKVRCTSTQQLFDWLKMPLPDGLMVHVELESQNDSEGGKTFTKAYFRQAVPPNDVAMRNVI